jgi:hypothetical protein
LENSRDDEEEVNCTHAKKEKKENRNYTKVSVNGRKIMSLIDGGSDVSLIRKDIAAKVGAEEKRLPTTKTLTSFNGKKTKYSRGATLNVSFMGKEDLTDAIVVDSLSPDFLLGESDLKKLGLSLKVTALTDIKSDEEYSVVVKPLVKKNASHQKQNHTIGCGEPTQVCSVSTGSQTEASFLKKRVNAKSPVAFRISDDAPIVQSKPFKLTRLKEEFVMSEIASLERRGTIRKSHSKYAAPCVMATKENGTFRMCQDYRGINRWTDLDPFPFAIIDDIINSMGGCKFFTKFDLKDAFHSIAITEDTKQFTSFVLPFGPEKMTLGRGITF